jgi:hypothetical protein
VASVGPRLILMESLEKDVVSSSDVAAVVDEVLLPLTALRAAGSPP